MQVPLSNLQKKWKAATDDLAIEIIVPFQTILTSGKEVKGEFLLPQFGAKRGMIITLSRGDSAEAHQEWVDDGYGCSILREPKQVGEYDRSVFISVLQDWGWTGEESVKPDWLA